MFTFPASGLVPFMQPQFFRPRTTGGGGGGDITSNLLGWWKFDEGSGTTATDSGSGGNNATLQNGATYATGQVGPYALSLDGSNDIASFNFSPPGSEFTIAMWIKPVSVGGNFAGLITFDPSAGNYARLCIDNGTNFYYARNGNSQASFGAVTANTWQHLVAVFSSTNIKAYRDGVLITTTANSGTPGIIGNGMFGRYYTTTNNYYYQGLIDDARIYGRSLAQADIDTLYAYR